MNDLINWLLGEKEEERKRVFISFSIEDKQYRDFLVAQSKNNKSPFDFIDMSVKEPWNESEWKKRCKTKIKRCHGVIVLLSNNTYHSSGVHYEIKCAKDEGIPLIGMHIKKNEKWAIPAELRNEKVINWSWDNIEKFINKL